MIDISQNYFVPRNMRSGRRRPQPVVIRERYTDCGTFFSATGFTEDAQNFAWAHGIYLVSFSEDRILRPILARASSLLRSSSSWQDNRATKADVVSMARSHFQTDPELRRLVRATSAYVGILDELYPVILVSTGEFGFSPEAPDNLAEEDMSFEDNRAFKERRIEGEEDVNFQFTFRGTQFSFSLPITIASKIIHAIETTYGGEAFAILDIPIVLQEEARTYRRIFRIHLSLPYRSDMINAFRQTV